MNKQNKTQRNKLLNTDDERTTDLNNKRKKYRKNNKGKTDITQTRTTQHKHRTE